MQWTPAPRAPRAAPWGPGGRRDQAAIATSLERLVDLLASPGPAALVERSRLHLFDALSAAHAGACCPEGARVGELGKRQATPSLALVSLGLRAPGPADGAAGLARLIRTTETDDLQPATCTTPAAVVVPATLAAAAAAGGADMARLCAAIVVGYEVMFRLGSAVGGPEHLYGGGWPTLAVAPAAAAAAAGVVLGLDRSSLTDALALGLACTPVTRPRVESARGFALGAAVASGLEAALAAATGTTGDSGILDEGPSAYRPAVFDSARLGVELASDGATLVGLLAAQCKRWCSAGQAAAAIDAAGAATAQLQATPDDVDDVLVEVPPAYAAMIDQPVVTDRVGSMLSVQYGIALGIADPDRLFDCVRSPLDVSGSTASLMACVRVEPAGDLAADYPARWPARVTVRTRGGGERCVYGDGPGVPWTWEAATDKAAKMAVATASGLDAGALAALVAGAEDSVELLGGLEGCVRGPARAAGGGTTAARASRSRQWPGRAGS